MMGGEAVQIALGTLVLATPMLAGFGLIVWSRASAPRTSVAFLPAAIAGALVVAGLVLAASAPEGFGGVPRVLLGAYLAGVGGVAMLACLAITLQRRRDEADRADRSASGDDVSDG